MAAGTVGNCCVVSPIPLAGEDVDVVGCDHAVQPRQGVLDHGLAVTGDVGELFGLRLATARPQARPTPPAKIAAKTVIGLLLCADGDV
ncbi:MAG: hypothetical protein R2838_19135 [Caldilineaceae bacterium]